MDRVMILTGPTAAGKSELAMLLAEDIPLEIVSADSRQVYRGLDVGTAKPSPAERERVPHHLIDLVDPGERYSAADFVRDAGRAVREILERNRLPLVVGGTGFYLQALIGDVELDGPPALPEVRRALQELRDSEGLETWRALVEIFELEVADPDNPHRLLRALEQVRGVHRELVNRGLLDELPELPEGGVEQPEIEFTGVVLKWSREVLYERINRRATGQFKSGLLEEAEWLRSLDLPENDPCLTGIGYREAGMYLDGEIDLEQAIEINRQRNRNYAKRQLTWFRNQFPDWERIRVDPGNFPEGALSELRRLAKELLPVAG